MRTRIHKYWKTAVIKAVSPLNDRQWVLLGNYALRLLRVVVLLSIWRTIFAQKTAAAGITLGAVLTYTLISEVFADQFSSRTGLDGALWEGTIATRFLRPMGIFGQFIAEMVGGWCLNLCLFSIPLLLISPLLGVSILPASVPALGQFVLSLILAISVGAALDFIFAALMVVLEHSIYALQQIRNAVTVLLSGAMLPLVFFPWGIGDLFGYLPFAAMASAPLRIYTGTGAPLRLLALQAAWSLILWPVVVWLWRANRERLVSHGG